MWKICLFRLNILFTGTNRWSDWKEPPTVTSTSTTTQERSKRSDHNIGVVAACAWNAFQALEMTARRKKRPKNQFPLSSLKRSCGAVKRGWCSIVKSAVGLSSDWIWAVVVYQSALWWSDRGCRVFWGAWQERATVRSNPRSGLGFEHSTYGFYHPFPRSSASWFPNSRFSVCTKTEAEPRIWTFLCHVETIIVVIFMPFFPNLEVFLGIFSMVPSTYILDSSDL